MAPTPDPEHTAAALARRTDWPKPPDQSRYGPRGTTDSPRYHSDGVTQRPPKETKA